MYINIFETIFGFASFTGNFWLDSLIIHGLGLLLHSVIFSFVGGLYSLGIITSSKAGRIAYAVTYIGTIIGIIYLINWLRMNWWILIIIGAVLVILLAIGNISRCLANKNEYN